MCERDRRCRAWSFNYPTDAAGGAVCWLKNTVPPRTEDNCCVSGVRGAGVVEPRNGAIETSIDRSGGDYRSFELKSGDGDEACKAACTGDNKCRAWTYARPGYVGEGRALLPEKGNQAAATQGRIYFGRGAVTFAASTRNTGHPQKAGRDATSIDPDLSKVQLSSRRANADRRLPVFLRLQGLRREAKAACGRLLRVLFLWIGAVPADPAGR